MFPSDVSLRDDPLSDPFGERLRPAICMSRQVLGARFRFESDSIAFLELVEAAYGSLPAQRFPGLSPEFHIELRVVPREAAADVTEPPPVRMQGGRGLLCGVVDASNYMVLAPAQRRGLIVVSEDMLAFRYHVRYELLEFAVFLLAPRVLNLVPLHGACIGRDGLGVLLLGPSGAGKSTLTLQGLVDGMDLLAEDSVFAHPESLLATGVPNFLHVKEDTLRFVDDPAVREWIRKSPVIHRRSGVAKYEADLRERDASCAKAPLRLAATVFVSGESAHGPDDLLAPVPWEFVAPMLSADQPYASGHAGWDRFVQRIRRGGVYRLRRAPHPRDAIRAVGGLLDRARPAG
ncbi:serine kinase [Luteibacter yeojuensis]|uniref:Serine kinase n=2 Tax=Luteibacter yeojuensis TaxID=345309 RepID=A0A7X5QV06_9GAMM|nr:serine kinase [Luteibacter yeojuensis]